MLANMVCSFIKQASQGRQGRIETTLAKAKAARVVAEKMISLGKKGQDKDKTVHYRRLAASRLRAPSRTKFDKKGKIKGEQRRVAWREREDVVHILFDDLAPRFKDRPGGYTRIIKLGRRKGDAAEMAILEWVESEKESVTETTATPSESKAEPEKKEEAVAEEKSEATEEEASSDAVEGTESTEEKKSEEAPEEKTDPEAPADETADTTEEESKEESAEKKDSAEGDVAKSEEEPKEESVEKKDSTEGDAAKSEDGDDKKKKEE